MSDDFQNQACLFICNHWQGLAATWFFHFFAEFWLGKTEKVKASSVLDLAGIGLVKIGLFIWSNFIWKKKSN